MKIVSRILAVLVLIALAWPGPARALSPEVLDSLVRLKPDWTAAARGRGLDGAPRDPEGTGVAISPGGYIATNVHVLGDATEVLVRLNDGRTLAGKIIGRDGATDLALLKVEADLPVLPTAPPPALAEPVCAIGNQFGLGLSVTCGVVSATGRAGIGFNPVEDFIQTDASVNPGGSGGALVDKDGNLVGLVSAIFTKNSDADIGVNFATSVRLLLRVARDLKDQGRVVVAEPGFSVSDVPPPDGGPGIMVQAVHPDGAAFAGGLEAADVITAVDGIRITDPPSLRAQLYMGEPGAKMTLRIRRGDAERYIVMRLPSH